MNKYIKLFSMLYLKIFPIHPKIINAINQISTILFYLVYRAIPKIEGEIDRSLENDINNGLDFFIVRFRNFNNSIENSVTLGLSYSLLSVVLVLFGISISILLQLTLSIPLNIVQTISFFIAAMLLYLALVSFSYSGVYLFANISTLFWFLLQKIRKSLVVKNKTDDSMYICKYAENPKGYIFKEISVFQKNLAGFYYICVYVLIAAVLLLFGAILPKVTRRAGDIINTHFISGGIDLPFSGLIIGLLSTIDNLTPINIDALLSINNTASLSYLIGLLLLFAAFRYYKRIKQHSTKSRFEWTKINEYSYRDELSQAYIIAKVVNYHYLKRDKENRYRIIFEELTKTIIYTSITVIAIIAGLLLLLNIN